MPTDVETTRSSLWLKLILFSSFLLLVLASPTSAESNQRLAGAAQKDETVGSEPKTSPAFYAAILGELRDLVQQEVTKREQDHNDHKDWNTKPFWIVLGVNALVGGAYTIVACYQLAAIRRQADILTVQSRPWISSRLSTVWRSHF